MTYTQNVFCENCDFKGSIQVKKGTLASAEKCPNCECRYLLIDHFDDRVEVVLAYLFAGACGVLALLIIFDLIQLII